MIEDEIKIVCTKLSDEASRFKGSVLWEQIYRHSEKAIREWIAFKLANLPQDSSEEKPNLQTAKPPCNI